MIVRHDLHRVSFEALRDQRGRPARDFVIRTTSGTSGEGALLMTTQRNRGVEIGFFRDLKRPAIFFGSITARLAHLTHALFHYDISDILIMKGNDFPAIDGLLEDFKPDSLCGFPSFIVAGLLSIKSREALKNVRAIHFLGERLSRIHLEIIQSRLPNARLYCFYGAAETGLLTSFPCNNLPVNIYHPARDVEIEICKRDRDGIGEIIVSYPASASVFVRQYDIGDMGRLLPEPCACGNPITFEVLGRKDFDYIKLAGTILRQDVFDETIKQSGLPIKDYRVEAAEAVHLGKLVGKIKMFVTPPDAALTSNPKDREEFAKKIAEAVTSNLYLTPTKTLRALVHEGLFMPIHLEIADYFPHQHKSIKIRRAGGNIPL